MATPGTLRENFLTCNICMEDYQEPVTLACQHSFCRTCLGKYLQTKEEAVRNKTIPCPTCRQETPVPHPDRPLEDWVGQLKPGLLLTGLMDSVVQEASHQCMVCQEEGKTTPATHWCSECETSFCDGCLKLHNKMPSLKKHKINTVTEIKAQQQKEFMCKQHDKLIDLFCKDCDRPLCTACSTITHRTCKAVVTIKSQLAEVKSKLEKRQNNLAETIDSTNVKIKQLDIQTNNILLDRSKVESDIRRILKEATDTLKQKKDQLIKKVTDQTEQDQQMLRSMMQSMQMDLQLYQQQSQSIQQALELEDEAQLFEMYLSEAGKNISWAQVMGKTDVPQLSFIHPLDQLKDQIDMMDVKIEKANLKMQNKGINLSAAPVLGEVIDAKLNVTDACNLTDSLVMDVAGTQVTLLADFDTKYLKSFYIKGGKACSTGLKVFGNPRCMTVVSEGNIAVSVPGSQRLIAVTVSPDLELRSTIQTGRDYWALSALDQSTLVAGSKSPPSVDLIDMEGSVLKSFTTLPAIGKSFIDPHYIHVTRQGTILVSDYRLKSVICLTQSGDIVFTYTPTGDRALKGPWGITTTNEGDILVADCKTHKVIHLNNSGEFIRDILTAKNGLQYPTGLCLNGDNVCVTLSYKGLHKYTFGKESI